MTHSKSARPSPISVLLVVVGAVLSLPADAIAQPLAGVYLISNDASEMPDYADLGEAFDDLESQGIGGPVILRVSEGTGPYTSTTSHLLGDVSVAGLDASNTVTIRPQAGESPVVQGDGAVIAFGSASGPLAFQSVGHVHVEGLELRGGSDFGILFYGSAGDSLSDFSVRGCRIHDIAGGGGILVLGDGVMLAQFAVENNMIWGLGVTGGVLQPLIAGAIGFFNVGEGTTIRHNTVVIDSATAALPTGAAIHATAGGYGFQDLSYNVFVLAADGYRFLDLDHVAPAQGDRNIYHRSMGAGDFGELSGSSVSSFSLWQAMTYVDGASVEDDPALASITHGAEDLHLTPQSVSAIDNALASTVPDDIDGDLRPGGVAADIGADEACFEYYPDGDSDGWGDASAAPTRACGPPAGMVTNGDDCDDGDSSIHPDAIEDCGDLSDNDCDGDVDGDDADCAGDDDDDSSGDDDDDDTGDDDSSDDDDDDSSDDDDDDSSDDDDDDSSGDDDDDTGDDDTGDDDTGDDDTGDDDIADDDGGGTDDSGDCACSSANGGGNPTTIGPWLIGLALLGLRRFGPR